MIDAVTGSTSEKVRGATAIYASPHCSSELIAERNRYRIRGQKELDIPALSFIGGSGAVTNSRLHLGTQDGYSMHRARLGQPPVASPSALIDTPGVQHF